MEIVRVPEVHEFSPEDQKFLEAGKAWFKIDFVPKMARGGVPSRHVDPRRSMKQALSRC